MENIKTYTVSFLIQNIITAKNLFVQHLKSIISNNGSSCNMQFQHLFEAKHLSSFFVAPNQFLNHCVVECWID